MNEATERFLCQLELRQGATREANAALQESLGTALPSDFLDFLRRTDGGIGHGPDLFVILDRAAEVAATTAGYGAPEYAPGLKGQGEYLALALSDGSTSTSSSRSATMRCQISDSPVLSA